MEKDMKRTNRTFLSEWYGRGNERTAQLYSTWCGYEVEFKKGEQLIERRMLWEHNRNYAEDACENWVEEIIK